VTADAARTTQQLLAEIWTLMDWLPYLLDLNLLDFSICIVLQAKGQAMPHANPAAQHPSIATEWD
jgi:hypothetical protein